MNTPHLLSMPRGRAYRRVSVLGLLLLLACALDAAEPELEVFVRQGCPHCAAAETFLAEQFAPAHPELAIRVRDIDDDAGALAALETRSAEAGIWPPGVPTFVYGEHVMVGFDDDPQFAQALHDLLARAPPHRTVDAGPLGELDVQRLGLPLFTVAIGLLDGFNPCAMWVLLFLLSMLVRLDDRRRMALIAGTFVIVSGAVYYAFMAAWLNVFLVLGMSTPLRLALATLALTIGAINARDALRGGDRYTLSIPADAKPGLYARMRGVVRADRLLFALPAAAALAVVVNFVELLCTAGLPALYTAILAQQALAPALHYAYLALYITAYMADDTLMVGLAVIALSSAKLDARGGRALKLVSAVVMLALGSVMLLAPGVLM